jgi:glycerophosphoryl diester phosphodiesterase
MPGTPVTTTAAARPLLIARGGDPTVAPEHTIPAYEAALDAGADVLALDVHLSADDQLVVIHDRRLERTTDGHGPVRAHTLRQLKRLDAGRWFGPAFRGQRIQTLSEVLERFRDRTAFAIELPGGTDGDPGLEARVVTLLQIARLEDRALIAAVDRQVLRACRDLDPDLRLAARVAGRLGDPAALDPDRLLGVLCLEAPYTTAREVAACRAAGLDCYAGIVNEPGEAQRLAACGVTGLVTDRAGLVRAALEA